MARSEIRPLVKLRSTAGTGYTYVSVKGIRTVGRIGVEAAVARLRVQGEKV